MKKLALTSILALFPLMLLTGCSFDHDWDAAASHVPSSGADITGRWRGTWTSQADGHTGDLRCLITQKDEHTYHARFVATYAGFMHFGYELDLIGDKRMDEWVTFQGHANLGFLAGGEYRYEGLANSAKFICDYTSSADHGQFNMSRP